jgi:hypothetical protein
MFGRDIWISCDYDYYRKRRRSWHHGPGEDRRFDEAIRRLQQDGCPETDTTTRKGETK